jgi:transposase InsO family protein
MAEAFLDYNRATPHSSLGYLTPYEFPEGMKKRGAA